MPVPAELAPPRRRTAAASAVAISLGAVAIAWTVTVVEGPWYPGYVSEVGIAARPYAEIYRYGLLSVALGLLLLAVALAPRVALVASLIGLSGGSAMLSSTVTCSAGCPLPPNQTATIDDVIHAATSALGVGLCCLAILVIALNRVDGPLRRLSRLALWPVVPAGTATVIGLSFVGRAVFTSTAERVLLLVILVWAFGTAVLLARSSVRADA